MLAPTLLVIGASAGGIPALLELVRAFPADLPAAVCIVLHLSPAYPSHLATILARAGTLPAVQVTADRPLLPGQIYVAPPDCHLLVRSAQVAVSHGPREHGTRPAIDPLFRSAAQAYGARVCGVVLSGALGDGAMGLAAIKAHGGYTLVQDPDEARFASMPRTALSYAGADEVLPVIALGRRLVQLIQEGPIAKGPPPMPREPDERPAVITRDLRAQAEDRRTEETSTYSCPECGGVLWQLSGPGVLHFQCHVGHTYSSELLLVEKSEALEAALWASVRLLTEKATLHRQLAQRAQRGGDPARAARIEEQAVRDETHIRLLREALLETLPNPTMQVGHILEEGGGDTGPPPAQ